MQKATGKDATLTLRRLQAAGLLSIFIVSSVNWREAAV